MHPHRFTKNLGWLKKMKRSDFSISFMMIALFAITAALQLLSAYGAICIAWDPYYRNPPFSMIMFPYVAANELLFQISNIVTWIGAIFWGYIIYRAIAQKKGVWIMALFTSVISFAMGVIPAMIADSNNFAEGWQDAFEIGSPHWARTFANFLVLILLLIPPMKKGLDNFAASEQRMTGSIAQQIMLMSMFFFWLSIVSFLGTSFMASAHILNGVGVNVWRLVDIQSIGAYTTLAAGVSMLGGGFILKQFNPSKALITTVEVNE